MLLVHGLLRKDANLVALCVCVCVCVCERCYEVEADACKSHLVGLGDETALCHVGDSCYKRHSRTPGRGHTAFVRCVGVSLREDEMHEEPQLQEEEERTAKTEDGASSAAAEHAVQHVVLAAKLCVREGETSEVCVCVCVCCLCV
jgi:hypothetical protein